MSNWLSYAHQQQEKWTALPTQLRKFYRDYRSFRAQHAQDKRFSLSLFDLYPVLGENTSTTAFEPHYIYHPAWALRILKALQPKKHVDISSTLHFCTMASAFFPVDFYDYRPAKLELNNLRCLKGNLLHLPFKTHSVGSLSCMHTVEHIGLGRYGDKVDAQGDRKAMAELQRVVAKKGSLLFVTPVGQPRLRFNAHRIYSYEQILDAFPELRLREFSLVPDNYQRYGLIRHAHPSLVQKQRWGCGCFWFERK